MIGKPYKVHHIKDVENPLAGIFAMVYAVDRIIK